MTSIWIFNSNYLTMFAYANNYHEARIQFKNLLQQHLQKEPKPLLDELIMIARVLENGSLEHKDSHIEFTDTWLKELGIHIDVIDF